MGPILIADDHPLFRDALSAAVRRMHADVEIAEAATLAEARSALERTAPGLLLLDLHMEDSQGFAGLIGIRHDWPALPVVVVSASEDPSVIRRAIEFGASGFIPKSSDLPTICAAIEAVLSGDVWTPAAIAQDPEPDAETSRLATLTPAQLRVLIGLKQGRLNKQIAYDMGISEATVKAHVTAVFRKLGVINRTQAVLAAEALDVSQPAVSNSA